MNRPTTLLTNPIDSAAVQMIESIGHVIRAPDTTPQALYRLIGEANILVPRDCLPKDLFDRSHRLQGIVRDGEPGISSMKRAFD